MLKELQIMLKKDAIKSLGPLKVAVLVSMEKFASDTHETAPEDVHAELESDDHAESYARGIRSRGHEAIIHNADADLAAWLREVQPDICFNTCEGFIGDSREAQIPALLEMIGYPYTGPTPLSAAITHDKAICKRVAHTWGVRTPAFQVFETADDPINHDLIYPLFVKPLHEGTGMGIKLDCIVRNEKELRIRVAEKIDTYKQPALVEDYIEGKDITCGLVGNGDDVHIFPITEVDFSGYPPEVGNIYGYEAKVPYDALYKNKCPAPLGDQLTNEVRQIQHKVFRIMGCRDFCRCDYRLTDDGRLYFLEVNALPGVNPRSDLTLISEAEGWTHADLISAVLESGAQRYGPALRAINPFRK